tara:strand:+ start:5473 stop:6411 length:939 start_codon:yes stop_codon:yes gene_type:complete
MATLGTFFLDGPTLATSTTVFTDATLTTAAADGWYSDSVNYRQQIGGVLGPVVACPSCVTPCGSALTFNGANGLYEISYGIGNDIGAIIVYFDPANVVDGISCVFGNQVFNTATSPQFGFVGSGSTYNFLGASNASGANNIGPTLNAGGYTGQDFYLADANGNFPNTPTNTNGVVTGSSADVNLTPNTGPGDVTIVIPRTSVAFTTITLRVFGPPGATTAWDATVNCPVALTPTPISAPNSDCSVASFPDTVYAAPNIGGTPGSPAINEFAFSDANGEIGFPPGNDYVINLGASTALIDIDQNHVITSYTPC